MCQDTYHDICIENKISCRIVLARGAAGIVGQEISVICMKFKCVRTIRLSAMVTTVCWSVKNASAQCDACLAELYLTMRSSTLRTS